MPGVDPPFALFALQEKEVGVRRKEAMLHDALLFQFM